MLTKKLFIYQEIQFNNCWLQNLNNHLHFYSSKLGFKPNANLKTYVLSV